MNLRLTLITTPYLLFRYRFWAIQNMEKLLLVLVRIRPITSLINNHTLLPLFTNLDGDDWLNGAAIASTKRRFASYHHLTTYVLLPRLRQRH